MTSEPVLIWKHPIVSLINYDYQYPAALADTRRARVNEDGTLAIPTFDLLFGWAL